jgi:hypothetical protein
MILVKPCCVLSVSIFPIKMYSIIEINEEINLFLLKLVNNCVP